MTLLYNDSIFLEHETGDHPECAGRIILLRKSLEAMVPNLSLSCPDWNPVSIQRLARVHGVEGGYDPDALADCVAIHLKELSVASSL
jgi:acetoin utilization deacetylase AcuC-like enzyme